MSEYEKAVVYESAPEVDGMGCGIGENKNYANQTKLIYWIGENYNTNQDGIMGFRSKS